MSRYSFLDKTLRAVTGAAQQLFFSDVTAGKNGLLQRADPRVKVLTSLFVLVMISLLHTPGTLLFVALLAFALAVLSGIGAWRYLLRVWMVVPLFSAAFVLPTLLNIVTPGDPVFVLARLDLPHSFGPVTIPREIAITVQGIVNAAVFVLRVGASVSVAVLLTLTTPWSGIFTALRSLRVPSVFVMTLSMTERYLFVFLHLIEDMYRARMSRTINPLPADRERSWTASRIGVTFKRSMDMSEDIYKAMISRGFRGEFPAMDRLQISKGGLLGAAGLMLVSLALFLYERGFIRP